MFRPRGFSTTLALGLALAGAAACSRSGAKPGKPDGASPSAGDAGAEIPAPAIDAEVETASPIGDDAGGDVASPDVASPDADAGAPSMSPDADAGPNACQGSRSSLAGVQPLFTMADVKNPPIVFESTPGVLVTRGAGRVHRRHEKEGSYGPYVTGYFEERSYGFTIEDFTPGGQKHIRVTFLPLWTPTSSIWKAWKQQGNNATFLNNDAMVAIQVPPVPATGAFAAVQQFDQVMVPSGRAMAVGETFEFELTLETAAPPRDMQFFTDTFRYRIGKGGLTPDNRDFEQTPGPLPEARLGGDTTLTWMFAEPHLYFSQPALDIQHENIQPFLEGRRLFNTNFVAGTNVETGNVIFTSQQGKAGPLQNTATCQTCHLENGPGAPIADELKPSSSMVFRLSGAAPAGRQLQPPEGAAAATTFVAKTVSLADGTLVELRKQMFTVTAKTGGALPFSARIATPLIGLGLLEAIDDQTIASRSDPVDCDKDGISGRIAFVKDAATGVRRVGRFGWKAEQAAVVDRIAEDAASSLDVGTNLVPDSQGKVELADADLAKLAAYMRLLGVPPQRNAEDPVVMKGRTLFNSIGCAGCHLSDVTTSAVHPFAELRAQKIKPYTDLLLHDMGPDLADDSGSPDPGPAGESPPSASEWRTPPLWGVGLRQTINGNTGLLHDGRAADVEAAILWHGGEASNVTQRYVALPIEDRAALRIFVDSL